MRKLFILSLLSVWVCMSAQTLVPYLKKNGKYIYVNSGTLKPAFEDEFDFPELDSTYLFLTNYKVLQQQIFDKKGKKYLSNVNQYFEDIDRVIPDVPDGNSNLIGLLNIKGEKISEPQKQYLTRINTNNFFAQRDNGKSSIVDLNGNDISLFKCDSLEAIYDQFISYFLNGKCGIRDFNGNELTPPIFSSFPLLDGIAYSDGYIKVLKDGWYGFNDKNNKEVIPCQYAYATDFKENRSIVKIETGNYAIIDKNGKTIFSLQNGYCDENAKFINGFVRLKIAGEHGRSIAFVDLSGNINYIVPINDEVNLKDEFPKYNILKSIVLTPKNKKFVLGGNEGSDFESSVGFEDGLLGVKYDVQESNDNSWKRETVFFDSKGTVKLIFKSANLIHGFSNGFAVLSHVIDNQEKSFFVDKNGQEFRDK